MKEAESLLTLPRVIFNSIERVWITVEMFEPELLKNHIRFQKQTINLHGTLFTIAVLEQQYAFGKGVYECQSLYGFELSKEERTAMLFHYHGIKANTERPLVDQFKFEIYNNDAKYQPLYRCVEDLARRAVRRILSTTADITKSNGVIIPLSLSVKEKRELVAV